MLQSLSFLNNSFHIFEEKRVESLRLFIHLCLDTYEEMHESSIGADNREEHKWLQFIFSVIKIGIISVVVGMMLIKFLQLPKQYYFGILALGFVLFGIDTLHNKFRKKVIIVGNGKKITSKKLRYGIEKKITPVKRFLCKVTPNTIQPKELEECMDYGNRSLSF